MTVADRRAWALGQADKAQALGRRCAIVDAVLKGQAAGLTLPELVDLVAETEAAMVYADREELADLIEGAAASGGAG